MNERLAEHRAATLAGKAPPKRASRLETRSYFCKQCGLEEVGSYVPEGWYSVSRHAAPGQTMWRVGIYCSEQCLQDGTNAIYPDGNRHDHV